VGVRMTFMRITMMRVVMYQTDLECFQILMVKLLLVLGKWK